MGFLHPTQPPCRFDSHVTVSLFLILFFSYLPTHTDTDTHRASTHSIFQCVLDGKFKEVQSDPIAESTTNNGEEPGPTLRVLLIGRKTHTAVYLTHTHTHSWIELYILQYDTFPIEYRATALT